MDSHLDVEPCSHEVMHGVETVLGDIRKKDSSSRDRASEFIESEDRACDFNVQPVQICSTSADPVLHSLASPLSCPSLAPSRSKMCSRLGTAKVRFDFAVAFWFPEAEQITLPVQSSSRSPKYSLQGLSSHTCFAGPPSFCTSSLQSGMNPRPAAPALCSSSNLFGTESSNNPFCTSATQQPVDIGSSPCGLVKGWSNPVIVSLAETFCRDSDVREAFEPASATEFFNPLPVTDSDVGGHVGFRPHIQQSSVRMSSGPDFLTAVRRKPQSKQAAFRLGHEPYCPPSTRNPGLHRPLSVAGHFRTAEPQVDDVSGTPLNPFSSFDEVNGARVLNGEPDWSSDRYIAEALHTARLPGTPLARFVRHELIDFPGPQIALTQDHGRSRYRAIIFDFRSLQGEVEVIDTPLAVSVLDQVRLSRTITDVAAASFQAMHVVPW